MRLPFSIDEIQLSVQAQVQFGNLSCEALGASPSQQVIFSYNIILIFLKSAKASKIDECVVFTSFRETQRCRLGARTVSASLVERLVPGHQFSHEKINKMDVLLASPPTVQPNLQPAVQSTMKQERAHALRHSLQPKRLRQFVDRL